MYAIAAEAGIGTAMNGDTGKTLACNVASFQF
jgi:hypothetical protein